jgi:hypothetical protein
LAFEILRSKCSQVVEMFGFDYRLPVCLYLDASQFAARCIITQQRIPYNATNNRTIEYPLLFDSFLLSLTQQNYSTYKRELLGIV